VSDADVHGAIMQNDLLNTLLAYGQKGMQASVDNDRQQAYLSGERQKLAGVSEDELQSDALTSNWTKNGYNDAQGRIAMADREVKINQDMPKLREQSPEVMAQYLQQSQAEIAPIISKMSPAAQSQVLPQLMQQDTASMMSHNKQHMQYIQTVQGQAIDSGVQTQLQLLDASKGDAQLYAARSASTFQSLMSNIQYNPQVTPENKQKYWTAAANYLLSNNHQQVFDQIQNMPVDLGNGKTGTILSTLPIDSQNQLGEAFRKSLGNTSIFSNQTLINQLAQARATLHDPTATLPTAMQFSGLLMQEAQMLVQQGKGAEAAAKYQAGMQEYYTVAAKQGRQQTAWTAALAGDMQGVSNAGSTPSEAVQGGIALMQKSKTPLPQQLTTLVSAGLNGTPEAFKAAGNLLQPTVAQLRTNTAVDTNTIGMLETTLNLLDSQQGQGKTANFASITAGMSDDNAAWLSAYRDARTNGHMEPQAAQAAANEQFAKNANVPPEQKKLYAASRTQDVAALVNSADDRGLFNSMWTWTKSLVSPTAQAQLQAEPAHNLLPGVGNTSQETAPFVASLKNAMAEEAQIQLQRDPYMSNSQLETNSWRAVAQRVVPTKDGPMILPHGATLQQALGVGANVSADRVGSALDEYMAPIKQQSNADVARYELDPAGNIRYHLMDRQGNELGSQVIPRDAVNSMITQQQQRDADQQRLLVSPEGAGVAAKDNPQMQVRFNGLNSASVDPKLAFDSRRMLIKFEGVTSNPYQDGPGKANGVGINSANSHYMGDGAWDTTKISQSFALASDDAMKQAVASMRQNNLSGPGMIQFMTDLAYQRGNLSGLGDIWSALKDGNAQQAVEAYQKLPQAKDGNEPRQAWRIKMLNQYATQFGLKHPVVN
jgi:hypothetical protein